MGLGTAALLNAIISQLKKINENLTAIRELLESDRDNLGC